MAEFVSHAPFELAWRCFAHSRGKKKEGVIISVHSMHSQEKVCFMAFGVEDNFPACGETKEEVSVNVHRMHSR